MVAGMTDVITAQTNVIETEAPGRGGTGLTWGGASPPPTRGTGLAGESPPPGACRPQGGVGEPGGERPTPRGFSE